MKPDISIIIRTLNEDKYLSEILESIKIQDIKNLKYETIIVDSGSSDRTLEIAKKFQCRITFIDKKIFSFGRSLNLGCTFSKGRYLVFISGHCVPANKNWLYNLVTPIIKNIVDYSYGRQLGRDTTKFSENQIFEKYFPSFSKVPQADFFCNNANSAISRSIWHKNRFNEILTGCEDMELAKRITDSGGKIGYVSDAEVYHIHDEDWNSVMNRFERESLALQKIVPEVHLTWLNSLSFFVVAIIKDFRAALSNGVFLKKFLEITLFRFFQYLGSYRGNHLSKKISKEFINKYYYPRWNNKDKGNKNL
jgi:rhamnosyltransferase